MWEGFLITYWEKVLSHRRLAAIMFTDIIGYTSLMGKDEDLAFNLIRKNLRIQKSLIRRYDGHFLKEIGDGILASFPLASDAVKCAKSIQTAVFAEGYELRIGIHTGEMILEKEHSGFRGSRNPRRMSYACSF